MKYSIDNTRSFQERLLIKEYESATKLIMHADIVRERLTSFFLAFGGVAGAGLTYLLQASKDPNHLFRLPEDVVASLLMLFGVLGFIVTGIISRLRRMKLHNLRIIYDIRSYFFNHNNEIRDIIRFTDDDVPLSSFSLGSLLWSLIVILVNSFFFAFGIFILFSMSWDYNLLISAMVASGSGGIWVITQLYFYYVWSRLPQSHL